MALPHRVVGLICELGRAERDAVTLENGDEIPAEQEDAFQIRKHVHLGTSSTASDNQFEYDPSGNHHYFANFPDAVLTEIDGTLNSGSYDGTPRWDLEGQTYTVRTAESADSAVETDDLPSWLKAWIEPVACYNNGSYHYYDFSTIDEGHPDFNSIQTSDENGQVTNYDENSARAEAQALFDAYCAVLRQSLTSYESTYSQEDAMGYPWGVPIRGQVYPRWKTETPYTELEAVPYEKSVCPLTGGIEGNPFISPIYRSLSADTVDPTLKFRGFYDFSFSMLNADWGPWRVVDYTPEHHPEESGTYVIQRDEWVYDQHVQNQYPNMGMSDNFPNNPPYWTDEDQDGIDDTWWTPYGHIETFYEEHFYSIPAWDEYHTYEFDYPQDVKPSYTSTSRWKVKCEWNPVPPCCSPVDKIITFKVVIYTANMVSKINNESIDVQSPTTRYRNCHIKGYAKGEMGDLEYFHTNENPSCGPMIRIPPMHWAYYGHVVRPVYSTSSELSTITVTKTIGQDWEGEPEFDIEIPASDGKVTYIADFWIDSIT